MTKEIELKQPNLEQLNVKCEEVTLKSADPQMSSAMIMLATRFQTLQATAKVTRMHSSRMRTGRSLTICLSQLRGGGGRSPKK